MFGVSPQELALGVMRVVNSHMAKALAAVSLERGYPRDFTLFCFGGAGDLHVCELAQELGMRRIIIPAQAGVLSALGMALAGLRRDLARTLLWRGQDLSWENLQQAFLDLKRQGLAELAADGLEPGTFSVAGEGDLRYQGQTYTLAVPLAPNFLEAFQAQHQRLYGLHFPDREVEAVVVRAQFLAQEPPANLPVMQSAPDDHHPALPGWRLVTLPGPAEIPLHWRPFLKDGFTFAGPALILEAFATNLVLPGFRGEVAAGGHLVLKC